MRPWIQNEINNTDQPESSNEMSSRKSLHGVFPALGDAFMFIMTTMSFVFLEILSEQNIIILLFEPWWPVIVTA